jgi:hypothetical protein
LLTISDELYEIADHVYQGILHWAELYRVKLSTGTMTLLWTNRDPITSWPILKGTIPTFYLCFNCWRYAAAKQVECRECGEILQSADRDYTIPFRAI